MIGALVLGLRLLLVLVLYIFLGWIVWTIGQDLRRAGLQSAARKIPTIRLELKLKNHTNVSRSFSQPEITLGRDPTCDLLLDEATVSTRHAKLSYHHHQWWIEDLKSTNGTSLNRSKLHTATVLTNGDEIRCGKTRLIVSLDGEKGSYSDRKTEGDS